VQLIDDGAKPHLQNEIGMTPLMLRIHGCERGGDDVLAAVSSMLAIPGNLALTERCGNSAMLFACDAASLTLVRLLGDAGASYDVTNHFQQTALMLAATRRDAQLLSFLLGQNFTIDAQDRHANTALHYACVKSSEQCVALLLEHGANWRLCNIDGAMAFDLCTNKAVLALLASWAAKQAMIDALQLSAPCLDPSARRYGLSSG
jgi:ankyrin repeat protein